MPLGKVHDDDDGDDVGKKILQISFPFCSTFLIQNTSLVKPYPDLIIFFPSFWDKVSKSKHNLWDKVTYAIYMMIWET